MRHDVDSPKQMYYYKIASEPVEDAVSPSDVTATIYHLLGLDPRSHFHDALGRPYLLSEGNVLDKYLGA